MSEQHPICLCNGGPHALAFCGRTAVVVCTERTDAMHPLQWYAFEAAPGVALVERVSLTELGIDAGGGSA